MIKRYFRLIKEHHLLKQQRWEKYPELAEILNKLAGKISEEEMSEMNYQVNVEGQDPSIVAKDYLKEKNLLIYNVYTDFDSAKKLSPTKRKGLSKLLADAKAGCFKTVIIYRLDRLVRRYKDWLEIKIPFLS